MRQFENMNDYLSAYKADPHLAMVPVPLVADYLGVTPAAITHQVRVGHLEGVRIGAKLGVAVSSLLARQDVEQQENKTVREVLEAKARNRIPSVNYDEIMRPLGLSHTLSHHRRLIGQILGRVSRESHHEKGVPLSVLVHSKNTNRPAKGFFSLVKRELGYRWDDEDEFVTTQTERVFAAYASD